MVIVLPGVVGQRFPAQLAAGPGEIERMSEKMLRRDLVIDGSVSGYVSRLASALVH